jgi:hypothetical protein
MASSRFIRSGSIDHRDHARPKGQKRRADVIGNAIKMMKIATGERQRSKIARTAASARWKKSGG